MGNAPVKQKAASPAAKADSNAPPADMKQNAPADPSLIAVASPIERRQLALIAAVRNGQKTSLSSLQEVLQLDLPDWPSALQHSAIRFLQFVVGDEIGARNCEISLGVLQRSVRFSFYCAC